MLPKYLKHSTFSSCFWSIIIVTGDENFKAAHCQRGKNENLYEIYRLVVDEENID
jgi:hypothetical protein